MSPPNRISNTSSSKEMFTTMVQIIKALLQLSVFLRIDSHLLYPSDNHYLYPSDNHLLNLSDKHHLHLSDNHLLHLIYKMIQMMLKLLYTPLLQLSAYLRLDNRLLHLPDKHLLHLIIKMMMLKLLYATLLQLHVYLFLLDNPTMIRLCLLHHHVNQLSFIHLLILANINLLLCLKFLQ
jgi:hypothetical protein